MCRLLVSHFKHVDSELTAADDGLIGQISGILSGANQEQVSLVKRREIMMFIRELSRSKLQQHL